MAFSMSPTSIDNNFLSVCRWQWCSASFDSPDHLVDHVLKEHIAKAKPLKRRDVDVHFRAQDGASFEDSMPLNIEEEDNKEALRAALNLPSSFSSSGAPFLPSPPSPASPVDRQAVESLVVSSPITPRRTPSSRPRLSIRTPDSSPQPQRFHALLKTSSPTHIPDYSPMARSPTTQERITDILERRRRSTDESASEPFSGSAQLASRNEVIPGTTIHTNGTSSSTTEKSLLPMAPALIPVISAKDSISSSLESAVAPRSASHCVKTPLTNILRRRHANLNEANINRAILTQSDESQEAAASPVTESATQSDPVPSQTPFDISGPSAQTDSPSSPVAVQRMEVLKRPSPSPKPALPYNLAPFMKSNKRPASARAHETPPSLTMFPSMRLRHFQSGHITLETIKPRKPKKPKEGVSPIGDKDAPVADVLDADLASQWPMQTQAPYDFDILPIQSQWKPFADSQT